MKQDAELFPIPTAPPVYDHPPAKVTGRRFLVYDLVSSAFIVLALVLALWLAVILLVESLVSGWLGLLYAVLFWGLLAYLALPRLYQVITTVFLPDYFIGRSRTADGILGDPINLAVNGSAEDVHAAMQRAGWTLADEITLRSSLAIIASSVLRRSYPNAPVSPLFLFDRRHAFAYQQEVDGNAAQRHHIRFWQTPPDWLLPGGHRVSWLADATYDRKVGLAGFTGQVTHKVDANIDIERDYVVNTVRYADPQCGVEVLQDFSTSYHGRNGGGDLIYTDGNLPILDVTAAAERGPAPVFAGVSGSGLARRRLPPTALLVTGALLALAIAGAAGLAVGRGLAAWAGLGWDLVAGAAWLLAVAHRRWAWVLLMLMFSTEAAVALAQTSRAATPDLSLVLTAGLGVLIVLAVSARSVRGWVHGEGEEPTVDLNSRRTG